MSDVAKAGDVSEDYSEYGKVTDEDEEKEAVDMCLEGLKATYMLVKEDT